ncbi:YwqG family protein [Paenibacillus tengchongensis]|uniref:YwqG family protein n=1 Tax=Paenibacillus tengchongensis TaxID=2608684 RepID=UPI00124EA24E|nr:YwqG family protein [Paenibacillus tengchongensis]
MADQAVIELLQSYGLDRIEQEIIAYAAEAVRLRTEQEEDELIGIGCSKLGGRPDLPEAEHWPQYEGRSLHFLAQIHLDQAAGLGETKLPGKGLLSFFYDAVEQPWGFDPGDRGRWSVLYTEGLQELERKDEPTEITEAGSFPAARFTFSRQTDLPDGESLLIHRLNLTAEERERYWKMYGKVRELNDASGYVHKLLGHPDSIQGDMLLECQLVNDGLYCGDATGYNDPRRELLEPEADRWKLLFQLDSEEESGMMWGDVGRLYFWITEKDLLQRDFSKVWVVQQCC